MSGRNNIAAAQRRLHNVFLCSCHHDRNDWDKHCVALSTINVNQINQIILRCSGSESNGSKSSDYVFVVFVDNDEWVEIIRNQIDCVFLCVCSDNR